MQLKIGLDQIDEFEAGGDEPVDLSGYAQTEDLAEVAFSGEYSDLANTPVIPDLSNVYTKSDVYTKTESNNRYPLSTNVYSKSEVYTKSESDSNYSSKSNVYSKSEVYAKNEVYNIADINAIIYAKIRTVSFQRTTGEHWITLYSIPAGDLFMACPYWGNTGLPDESSNWNINIAFLKRNSTGWVTFVGDAIDAAQVTRRFYQSVNAVADQEVAVTTPGKWTVTWWVRLMASFGGKYIKVDIYHNYDSYGFAVITEGN
jgi:hypothetical protein